MSQRLEELRYEPDREARARAPGGDEEVVDSTRALLRLGAQARRCRPSPWPIEDVRGELVPAAASERPTGSPPLLHPGIAFAEHSTDGREPSTCAHRRRCARGVAFAPADPDLAGHVILDYHGLRRVAGGGRADPRPPARSLSPRRHATQLAPRPRRAQRRAAGRELARRRCSSRRAFPRASTCHARTSALELRPERQADLLPVQGTGVVLVVRGGRAPAPGPGLELRGSAAGGRAGDRLVAFYDERVDVVLDGERRARPRTAVSKAIMDEAGISGE